MVARALVGIGQPAIEPLIVALKDWNSNVRSLAAEALGMIKDERVVEPLIAVLKNKNNDTELFTQLVAKALGKINDTRAKNALIEWKKARIIRGTFGEQYCGNKCLLISERKIDDWKKKDVTGPCHFCGCIIHSSPLHWSNQTQGWMRQTYGPEQGYGQDWVLVWHNQLLLICRVCFKKRRYVQLFNQNETCCVCGVHLETNDSGENSTRG